MSCRRADPVTWFCVCRTVLQRAAWVESVFPRPPTPAFHRTAKPHPAGHGRVQGRIRPFSAREENQGWALGLPSVRMEATLRGLRSIRYLPCARWCAIVWPGGWGRAGRRGVRAGGRCVTTAGAGHTGRGPRLRRVAGTLCGQPADGPRRACPSAHAACFRVQSGFHTRGDFRACNSECTCVRAHGLYRAKARPHALSRDGRPGVCKGGSGLPRDPATGERSPETCASCPGPGGWVGLLVGGKKQFWLLVGPWPALWGEATDTAL